MKAVVVSEFGPIESHTFAVCPDPICGPNDVIVDLEASEANYPDILFVEGKYQRKPDLPAVPGMGGAGRISEAGANVSGFSVGQKVLVLPDQGTFAERARVPAAHCIAVPENVPCDVAAAFGLAFQTAYFALIELGRFRVGETVMVLGAKGGVGSAAILLAKALGAACVVAVTRGAEGREVALACGADAVIDASDTDLRDSLRREVYAATDGRGVDVVIDPVGGAISEAAVRAMVWGGRLVIIGFASGGFPVFKGNYLLLKGLSVTGFQWTEHRDREIERVRAAQAKIFDLWSAGRLSPLISKQLPLEDFKQALSALQDGRAQGKIILRATG